MSRSSNLDLCINNSQERLGPDSLLVTSEETPDIRQWFSSYVYESPELSTSDGFENFDVRNIEGGVKAKSGEDENLPRYREELVAEVDENVDCDGSGDCELNQPAAVVLGLSSPTQFSETPHIMNWFSSYVYESPPPDTVDDVMIFGCKEWEDDRIINAQKTCKESVNDVKNITEVDQNSLLPKGSNMLPEISKFTNLEEGAKQDSQFICKVSGLSESPSQFSETPDIKNWFSSYVYESPPPDTIDDLTTFGCKRKLDDRMTNAQKAFKGTGKDVKNISDVEQDSLLPKGSTISSVILKCTNLVEDAKQDSQSACKDGHSVDLEPSSSKLRQWSSGSVSGQKLPEQLTPNQNDSSVEKYRSKNSDSRDYKIKSCCNLTDRNNKSLKMEKDTCMLDGKVLCKSTGNSLGKDDLQENVSLGASGSFALEGNPWRSQTARGSEKENEEAQLQENGFISTRKNNRHINSGNHRTESSGVQYQILKNRAKPIPDNERQNISRKALSETTNFHSPHTPEVTGKWHCPQKRKPDLGPPLKQLRLEHWIRRV